jgi:Xaa-Pro aminopeptidase
MNKPEFSKDFFISNRQRLRELFSGTAPIVITSNGVLQKTGDTNFPFEQDSSFWYLTGLDDPDLILVMDKGKEYLIVPQRSAIHDAFDGVINAELLTKKSGVKTILSESEGTKQLNGRLKKVKHVATLGAAPSYVASIGMYTNPARARLVARLKEANPSIKLLDLREHIARLRVIKQDIEILAIKQAIDITIDTLKEVSKPTKLSKYEFEYQLEADITAGFRSRGAQGHSFPPIVASGKQACVIHNMDNNAQMRSVDLVTLDVGAEVNHYAADITRTISLNRKASSRQKAVHQAVLEVQNYAFGLLKSGALLRDNEQLIEAFMGEKLREIGLIKSITTESVRKFYPHSASHFLGLDVHDVGNYSEPLEAGMVVTCEPGIYIHKEGIGVRIEDDVLITSDGIEILSSSLPRLLE